MITNEQYSRIVRFLGGEMTMEELIQFEIELKQDPGLREHLDFESDVRESLMNGSDTFNSAKEHLPDLKKSGITRREFSGAHMLRWIAVSAAACLLAVVYLSKLSAPPRLSKDAGFSKSKTNPTEITRPDSLEIVTHGKKPKDTVAFQGGELFKENFFPESIPDNCPNILAESFRTAKDGDPSLLEDLNIQEMANLRGSNNKQDILDTGYYYQAISLIRSGKITNAINGLQWITQKSKNLLLKPKAAWYLGLSYIKLDNSTEAKKWISQCAESTKDTVLKRKALSLLKKLK